MVVIYTLTVADHCLLNFLHVVVEVRDEMLALSVIHRLGPQRTRLLEVDYKHIRGPSSVTRTTRTKSKQRQRERQRTFVDSTLEHLMLEVRIARFTRVGHSEHCSRSNNGVPATTGVLHPLGTRRSSS